VDQARLNAFGGQPMLASLKPDTAIFWQRYLDEAADPDAAQNWLYEALQTSADAESADIGAVLIQRRIKTATCVLLWEFEATFKPLPKVGSLRIVENGRGIPVCIIKTTELMTKPFREVDLRFAYDYGEQDRTLKTWRLVCWQIFGDRCAQWGREADHAMPLVCERFRVLYPALRAEASDH
jgi:uncharacterized protein YhfF